MPKRKSPYKVKRCSMHDGTSGWSVSVGKLEYAQLWKEGANQLCDMLNQAYAHGYRNGMRAGRKG